MSGAGAGAVSTRAIAAWRVRQGEPRDAEEIATAVAALLTELGATPPPGQAMNEAAQELLEDPASGAVFVADSEDGLVGILTTNWLSAIHIPGRYGLIQDVWVSPLARSNAIGAALLAALFEQAGRLGITRIEVGLPKDSFPGLPATAAFYRANGFTPVGPRMRVVLA